jgi:hypothetical protein
LLKKKLKPRFHSNLVFISGLTSFFPGKTPAGSWTCVVKLFAIVSRNKPVFFENTDCMEVVRMHAVPTAYNLATVVTYDRKMFMELDI